MIKIIFCTLLFSVVVQAKPALSAFDCKILSTIGGTYKIVNSNASVIVENVSADHCVEPSLTIVENLRETKEYFTCMPGNSSTKDVKLEIVDNRIFLVCGLTNLNQSMTTFKINSKGQLSGIVLTTLFKTKKVDVLNIDLAD